MERDNDAANPPWCECEVFYREQEDNVKAATIKLMSIGCDDLVLALERAGTVKTKRPQAIREAQRRHNVLGLRGIRPGQAWNVDQINRSKSHPGESEH